MKKRLTKLQLKVSGNSKENRVKYPGERRGMNEEWCEYGDMTVPVPLLRLLNQNYTPDANLCCFEEMLNISDGKIQAVERSLERSWIKYRNISSPGNIEKEKKFSKVEAREI